jgi:polysaccharide biosynthesis protein PelD
MRLQPPWRTGSSDGSPAVNQASPAWQAWLETTGLALAIVAVGALVDRRDPFLLQRGFSWLVLAPLLAGLQYGSTHGLVCAGLQALLLAVGWRSGVVQVPDSVAATVLGWLVSGLLAGEFRDAWSRRVHRAQARAEHLRIRLEALGRSYLTLKISHDRLQREAPAKPESLRDALAAFRRELAEEPAAPSIHTLADRILALFADHAFARAATLHPVDAKGRPGPAVASLGQAAEVENDPLVRRAARSAVTASVREGHDGAAVLAAVPLVDARGRVHGVVAIREMPFVAFHSETLELLAVLGGRLGDCISRAQAPARTPTASEVQRPAAAPAPAPQPAVVPARAEEAA